MFPGTRPVCLTGFPRPCLSQSSECTSRPGHSAEGLMPKATTIPGLQRTTFVRRCAREMNNGGLKTWMAGTSPAMTEAFACKAPQFGIMFWQHIRSFYRRRSERRHGQSTTRRSFRLAGDDTERRACSYDGNAAPGIGPGFFDFLFGGFQQRPPQQETYPAPPAPGIGRVAPAPFGPGKRD